ncbi:MAG: hypothetical protein JWR17_2071, partial [Pseudomonas sp.]|uniref:hypothetical protein n=1 Tax=Pseudomonas sp. TaxID=306 RepID=UPI00263A0019
MSGLNEEIAQLTGKLVFDVKTAPLQAFLSLMERASIQMKALGREAAELQKKLDFKLGVRGSNTDRAKLDSSIAASAARELKLELAIQKARRATFAAELQGQKLTSAGTKESSFLATQALKDKQYAAVLASKEARAATDQLKTQAQAIRNEAAITAAKNKQTRLEAMLATQNERTALLQQKRQLGLSTMQRMEESLQRSREAGQRSVEKHLASVESRKLRMARQDTKAHQQDERFNWAQSRQANWAANAAKQGESSGGLGMSVGLGAAAAVAYAIGKAASLVNERIHERQESTSDTQQFDFALMAVSENLAKRKKLNEAYIRDSKSFGMAVNKDTAREYSNSAAGLMNHGYDDNAAATTLHNRMAVFRAANLDPESTQRVNYQMSHVVAKGYASGIDYKALTNNLGSKLAGDIDVGAAKYLGFKGKDEDAKAFMLAAQKKREITPKALDAGFAYTAVKNKDIVERHAGSIEANAQNLETDKFLQTDRQQQDSDLVKAINDRLDSERELVKATQGLSEVSRNLDIAFTRLETGAMRLLAGRNLDNTVKTQDQLSNDVGAGGTIEGYGGIDPRDLGTPKEADGSHKGMKDPVDRLWNWMTGKDTGPKEGDFTGKLDGVASNAAGQIPYDTSGLDMSHLPGFGKHLSDFMTSDYGQQIANLSSGPGNNPYTLDSPQQMQFATA